MADLVERVLQEISEKEAKYKTTEVEKNLDLEYDEGNLLAVDKNPIDVKKYRSDKEGYLKNLARDNTQMLLNNIWKLPLETVEDVVVAKLPEGKTILPREKPIPQPKPPTKWETYAQLKSINNRKRGRKVWDEETKEWRPRWGYGRAGDEKRDWMHEVPENADPYEDQFEKKNKAKKERVAKNELQRLRNLARNMKGKVPGVGLTPTETPDKDHLSRAMSQAHKSTASIGRFTDKLPKEKPEKSNRRKFEMNTGGMDKEKKRTMDVLKHMSYGRPTLNTTKAANQMIDEENRQRSGPEHGGKRQKMGKGRKKGERQGKKGGKVGKKAGKRKK